MLLKKVDSITGKAVQAGQLAWQRRVSKDKNYAQISDRIITGFAITMKAQGFDPLVRQPKRLRECPIDHCKQLYVGEWTKSGIDYWACPHCRSLFKERRAMSPVDTPLPLQQSA